MKNEKKERKKRHIYTSLYTHIYIFDSMCTDRAERLEMQFIFDDRRSILCKKRFRGMLGSRDPDRMIAYMYYTITHV